jgi:hypothetical protein
MAIGGKAHTKPRTIDTIWSFRMVTVTVLRKRFNYLGLIVVKSIM